MGKVLSKSRISPNTHLHYITQHFSLKLWTNVSNRIDLLRKFIPCFVKIHWTKCVKFYKTRLYKLAGNLIHIFFSFAIRLLRARIFLKMCPLLLNVTQCILKTKYSWTNWVLWWISRLWHVKRKKKKKTNCDVWNKLLYYFKLSHILKYCSFPSL